MIETLEGYSRMRNCTLHKNLLAGQKLAPEEALEAAKKVDNDIIEVVDDEKDLHANFAAVDLMVCIGVSFALAHWVFERI